MKKVLIITLTLIIIYFIYLNANKDKINYVLVSDNYNNINDYLIDPKIINNYNLFTNNSIIKMQEDIINNRTIRINNREYYFKKVLRESNLVVINIGMKELKNCFNNQVMESNYICFDNMYSNITKLIKELRKYAQEKIVFLGYYNPTNYYDANIDELFYNFDIRLTKLMKEYHINYVSLYNLFKNGEYKNKENIIKINLDE